MCEWSLVEKEVRDELDKREEGALGDEEGQRVKLKFVGKETNLEDIAVGVNIHSWINTPEAVSLCL